MKKNISVKKVFAVIFVIAMVFSATVQNSMAVDVFAKDNIENAGLKEKLQQNCWSVDPNPDSTQLTLNYAIKKIKAYVETSSKAYVMYDESVAKALDKQLGKKFKYVASTKTARTNLKWAICTGLISASNFAEYSGENPSQIDGSQILTRWDLVEILSNLCEQYYANRIPFFETDTKYWIFEESYVEDSARNVISTQKGIVTSKPTKKGQDEYANALNLNQPATREDLSRAMKNLKLILKNNAIKIYRYATEKEEYTFADASRDLKKLYNYLDENNIGYEIENISKGRVVKVTILKDPVSYIWFRDADYYDGVHSRWQSELIFANSPARTEKSNRNQYIANEVDFVKTVITILKKRNQ